MQQKIKTQSMKYQRNVNQNISNVLKRIFPRTSSTLNKKADILIALNQSSDLINNNYDNEEKHGKKNEFENRFQIPVKSN